MISLIVMHRADPDATHDVPLCPHTKLFRSVIATLRRQGRSGGRLGAHSTGSYLLAWAGLLDGYRCTVHWENLDAFREDFPSLDVTGELFEIDGPRLTCSGGTASLDMMLSLIRSEEHTELQSLMRISYAVFCLKKKKKKNIITKYNQTSSKQRNQMTTNNRTDDSQ